MSIKKQLLDPLNIICKLVALNFSELNTKISIHNHVLWLQKPNNYQFIIRMINGDGKENVSELFYAIIRVIKWYLIQTNESNENWACISRSDEIKRLVKYACIALRKLQETYQYGNVIFAIQYYIIILEDSINGNYNDNKLPKLLDTNDTLENFIDFDKLRNFWELGKLKRICDLYDNCFNVVNDNMLSNSEKQVFIEGYLKSINTIIELADNDFQKLVQNNIKG